jgi:hypothetical protein
VKYCLLALGCVAYGLALLALHHLASPATARAGLYAAYALAGAAAWTIAFSYERRDRLRWAWLSFGGGYLIAFVAKLFIADSSTLAGASPARALVWTVSVVLLNGALVTALVLFSNVWRGTGLAPPWRHWAMLAFLALGLIIGGQDLYVEAQAMLTLQPQAFGFFAAAVGDVIAIALVGPIFATALALRGGLLMRPWLFLFAGSMCWILDDAVRVLPPELGGSIDLVLRAMAVLLGGAAAAAQLVVKREVQAGLVTRH